MGDGCVLRIDKLENGYSVEIHDPKIEERNVTRKLPSPYVSPWKSFAFSTPAQVAAFVSDKLAQLHPVNLEAEFEDAFKSATKPKKG